MGIFFRRLGTLIILFIVMLSTPPACAAQAPDTTPLSVAPIRASTLPPLASGGTYIEGIAGFPQAINPLLSMYNDVDRDVCALVFEGLVGLDLRGVPQPRLAESWIISDDGLVYTFTLKTDVRWHDGAPFSADDVMFTVSVMAHPDFQAFDASGMFQLWSHVQARKLDSHRVEFTLAAPYAPFLDYTTMGILPAHILSRLDIRDLPKAQFNSRPIGTGPFKVSSVSPEKVVLDANPTYHGQRPWLGKVEFRFYPDAESLITAYQKGEIDGISRVTPHLFSRVEADSSLNVYSARLAKYAMILLNLNNEEDLSFFQEQEVRHALLIGLDRQSLVNRVLNGQATVAHSPMIPDTWAYNPEAPVYEYDPARARSLLESAGWIDTNGDGMREKDGQPLSFSLVTSDDPIWTRVIQEVARQWTEIGIQVETETISFPKMVGEYLYPRRFEAILIAPEFAGDPDPYPFWHSTQAAEMGQNWSGFSHRRADEIMEEARMTHDLGKRVVLYREFQEIFAQETPALLLYYPIYNYAISSKVQNVQVAPMNDPSDRFSTIIQWSIASRTVPLIGRNPLSTNGN